MTIRVMLVDDHELVRRGVAAVLSAESDMVVAGQFSSADEAAARVEDIKPDVMLMDLRMPGASGLQATALLQQRDSEVNVLILTVSEQAKDLHDALRAGARGYVLKGAAPEDLVHAVRHVAQGWVMVSPAMARKLRDNFPEALQERDLDPVFMGETLSVREWDVLQLLAEGMSNREIADRLVVSENTVKSHMRSILDKLRVKNRAQAAAYARQTERSGPKGASTRGEGAQPGVQPSLSFRP